MALKKSAILALVAEYATDERVLAERSISSFTAHARFREIFHTALSFEAVTSYISSATFRPSLSAPRALVLRIPVLVSLGQISAAQAELRRLLELVAWSVYFTDHRREWDEFTSVASKGFTQNQRTPIAYAAHREASFYLEYMDELMLLDDSGAAKQAVETLKQVHYQLNSVIHPGGLARGAPAPPFDNVDDGILDRFSRLLREALSNSALILCAFRRERFSRMPAGPRDHLSHLLSTQKRKAISKGNFGLP